MRRSDIVIVTESPCGPVYRSWTYLAEVVEVYSPDCRGEGPELKVRPLDPEPGEHYYFALSRKDYVRLAP